MRLLHFRRTFVEKMFAIHSKVELLKRDRQPIGTYARHYYDLHELAARDEVRVMLASPNTSPSRRITTGSAAPTFHAATSTPRE